MIKNFEEYIVESVVLKTKKGSPIRRYKSVGKKMGNDLYFHKKYVDEYIDKDFYNELKNHLPKEFKFNIIKYNKKNETISFINSPDFDTADEPIVSDSYKVTKTGKVTKTKEKTPPQIYHHKWLFVKDNYRGFNVPNSIKRSKEWLEVSDKINMSKIGSKGYWEEEVIPLLEGVEEKDDSYCDDIWDYTKDMQEYTSKDTSIPQIPKPFKHLVGTELLPGSINLDIGGGKYDIATEYLAEHGVTNIILDQYNRRDNWFNIVENIIKKGLVDTVTLMSVLNVIPERKNQIIALKRAYCALNDGGKVFVYSNYKDPKKESGPSGEDKWQHHQYLNYYIHIVREVFPNAVKVPKYECIVGVK
jgi:hypothetical protein